LPNGRHIGYCSLGPETGTPIIWLHGFPGSRLDALIFGKTAAELDCRLISIDRPGIGMSSAVVAREALQEYPADVTALADHLGLSKFRVLGVSGGGPYALACAAKLPPERLIATGIVAGLGSPEAGRQGMSMIKYFGWKVAIAVPSLALWFRRRQIGANTQEAVERMLDEQLPKMSPEDQKLVSDPDTRAPIVANIREAGRQGAEGSLQDAVVLTKPWGFDLRDVKARVLLWYAGKDDIATVAQGRWIKERLSNSELTVYEDSNHGIMVGHAREVFEQLLAQG
jgi:pimeloyl-ACP methyl ester carboxylesterase